MIGHLKGQAPPPNGAHGAQAAPQRRLPAPAEEEEDGDEPEDKGLQIPEGFIPGPFAKVKSADNDEKLVEALLLAFKWLAMKDRAWMKHMIGVVQTAKKAQGGDTDARGDGGASVAGGGVASGGP